MARSIWPPRIRQAAASMNAHRFCVCITPAALVAIFRARSAKFGHDRSIYATDLPGHGTSDVPSRALQWQTLLVRSVTLSTACACAAVDLFGHRAWRTGRGRACVARPQQVRRVMLWGVPLYTSQERTALLQQAPRLGTREDGADVSDEWRRMIENRGQGVPIAALVDEFSIGCARGLGSDVRKPLRSSTSDGTPAAGEAADPGSARAR